MSPAPGRDAVFEGSVPELYESHMVPLIFQLPSPTGSARVRSAPTSLPAAGSVRFIVAGHSPLTIFGR